MSFSSLLTYNNGSVCLKTVVFMILLCQIRSSWTVSITQVGELLRELQAECSDSGITVKLWFSKPFDGIAYSHGHYETKKCRYISQKEEKEVTENMGSSGTNFSFLIPMNECGTVYYEGKDTQRDKKNENEVYIENTLLIQKDPTIQEAGDVSKTLRCVWPKEIHQPLVASLPIGSRKHVKPLWNGKRVKTVSGKVSNNVTRQMQEDYEISQKNANFLLPQNATGHFNLRFSKKGKVQSVPVSDRRYYSRALKDLVLEEEEEEGEESLEYDSQTNETQLAKVPINNPGLALPLHKYEGSGSGALGLNKKNMILVLIMAFLLSF